MIQTFGNKLAEDIFDGALSKEVLRFPAEIRAKTKRKLEQIDSVVRLEQLRVPPGNRLEMLKGKWAARYSLRINDQWRVTFVWKDTDAFDVTVIDYH